MLVGQSGLVSRRRVFSFGTGGGLDRVAGKGLGEWHQDAAWGIVMSDAAETLKKNPDIQEFYLGSAVQKDYHAVKYYRGRKRRLA